MTSRRTGFTLIELLMVVAIIAILSAIGIVNLLHAQTRSKVARTRADQRTLATALEAYGTDANAYPVGNGYGLALSRPSVANDPRVLERLTTPVAYISAVPGSPFPPTRNSGNAINGISEPNTNVSTWARIDTNGPDRELNRLYQYSSAMASDEAISGVERVTNEMPGKSASVYIIQCAGPMLGHINLGGVIANSNLADSTNMMYDPTNGTNSFGNLFRTGGSAPREDNFLVATEQAGAVK